MSPWEDFFKEKIVYILENSKMVIDIGGGLRVRGDKGNRVSTERAWLAPYLEKVDYKILDPVPDYNPDIIGDIHNLPFPDEGCEAIICIAVLEHVENPIKACQEIHRVLKPGGYAFIYVPFLYYYHAEKGYYGDYWRFTKDTLKMLFKGFKNSEISPVRGALETWLKLSPIGKFSVVGRIGRFLDRITGRDKSNQVSGYNIFVTK